MEYFKKKKTTLVLILVPILLLVFAIFNTSKKENDLKQLLSDENSFFSELPYNYLEYYENAIKNDSTTIYSANLVENNFQRQLILIQKNPSKRAFSNGVIIQVYPKNKTKYIKSKLYNPEGFLDFTFSEKPIMYHANGDNYSVRKIDLPFVEIEKIFAKQPGIWKQTLENPYKPIPETNTSLDFASIDLVYEELFRNVISTGNIKSLNRLEGKQPISDYTKKNKVAIVKINDTKQFWKFLSLNDEACNSFFETIGDLKSDANAKIESYLKKEIPFNELVDIDKLAAYFAYVNLFSNNSSNQMGLVFDKEINKLEPIYLNTDKLGTLNTYIKQENITDIPFLAAYAKALKNLSYYDYSSFYKNNLNLADQIRLLSNKAPENVFEPDIIKHNQLVMKKGVSSENTIKAEFLKMDKNTFTVTAKNLSEFPIKINNLSYQATKTISTNLENAVILKGETDTITFDLPRSFENLFVQKKSKTTGFLFEKNIFDLQIAYIINGIDVVNHTTIIPYQALENYNKNEDLFRQSISLTENNFLKIDEALKTINLTKDFSLKKPLILPAGYTITATPGITINIEKGGKVISHSPIVFKGNKQQPIRVISKDKEGQGLLVLAKELESTLEFVEFDWLTNLSHGMWSTTSAITFYESPVRIDNIKISNNTCEDALNIVRADFKLTNSFFLNTQSDAFDGDFVTGIINSCVFKNLGNDAIDVSGSSLNISNVKIIKAGDKALSAGEDSQMKINNVNINDCAIAIAGKDLSIINAKNLTIKNTKLGFTAFQKKPEFGPSNITVNTVRMENVETKYLIENTSSLLVDEKKIETKQADVKSKMYGVEFGVSSDETRNKKLNK